MAVSEIKSWRGGPHATRTRDYKAHEVVRTVRALDRRAVCPDRDCLQAFTEASSSQTRAWMRRLGEAAMQEPAETVPGLCDVRLPCVDPAVSLAATTE